MMAARVTANYFSRNARVIGAVTIFTSKDKKDVMTKHEGDSKYRIAMQ